ncbi:hypothetical protein [Curvivirga sp.]|uniref:hypothetical protein n=1 Tax=Curvivirga sp. TaxID=2856848 RepID=UPI003B5C770C
MNILEANIGLSGGVETVNGISVCCNIEDFYRSQCRHMMARLLRPYFEKYQITPTELMFDKRNQIALEKNGSLLNFAISKAAELQAKHLGGEEKDREDTLNSLYSEYLNNFVSEELKKIVITESCDVDTLSAQLIEDVGALKAYKSFCSAIVSYLDGSPSWGTKAVRLMGLLKASEMPFVISILDSILSELLLFDIAVKDIFSEENNRIKLAEDLLSMLIAQPQPRKDASEVISMFHSVVVTTDLPMTSASLKRAFGGLIASPEPLVALDRHLDDDTPPELVELLSLGKLARLMEKAGGWFDNPRMVTIMTDRVAKLTGEEYLYKYTRRKKFLAYKIEELLRIYPLVYGDENKERVVSYLSTMILDGEFNETIFRAGDTPMVQLGIPGILEQKLRRANLPVKSAKLFASKLAGVQEGHIRKNQVFEKIRNLRVSDPEKGVYVLDLMRHGVFTSGRCKTAATKLVKMYLNKTGAVEEYCETIEDEDEREEKLFLLQSQLNDLSQ